MAKDKNYWAKETDKKYESKETQTDLNFAINVCCTCLNKAERKKLAIKVGRHPKGRQGDPIFKVYQSKAYWPHSFLRSLCIIPV